MTFSGVVRNPVYLQVAEQVRDAILAGDLAPGVPLPTERELAAQFGVSRQTVREALRALQTQGLISGGGRTSPLRSTVAAEAPSGPVREALGNLLRLQRVSLADLVEVRCALEVAALERAPTDPRGAQLTHAREAVAEMSRAEVTVEAFDDADVRFHLALVAFSGNEAMHLIMLAVRDAIASHLLDSLRQLPHRQPALAKLAAEHAAILQAVQAGDGTRAGELLRGHVRGFYADVLTEGPAAP